MVTGAGSRRKGATFELDVAKRLSLVWPDSRRELERRYDIGDIAGGPSGLLIECKNQQTINLAGFMTQTVTAAQTVGADHPLLVIKRRARPVGEAYAVMPFDNMIQLLKEAGR